MLDSFDSRRLAALRRTWAIAPPLFEVVASFAGVYRPKTPRAQLITTPEAARALLKVTDGKIDGLGGL